MTGATLVVADDRSGACDTGHQFAARGYETVVVGSEETSDAAKADATTGDATTVVVDTDSRYVDPATAASRVRDAVATHDPATVYKKVDSTLRGNLVAEVDAAVAAADADLALVAPAYPAEGRTTVGGYHLVDGTPVTETAAGDDADAPVESSHLPTRFEPSEYDVSHVPIDAVGAPATVAARLREVAADGDAAVVTCDAATDEHLAALARGATDSGLDVVAVGSAGLARHVRPSGERAPALGVVGSASPRTFAQLDALPDDRVVVLDGVALLADRERAVSTAVERAVESLEEADPVVLTAASSPDDVEATLAAADDDGLPRSVARERVAAGLAAAAAATVERAAPSGYLLSGGAVAAATLDALDADRIRLTGTAVEDGVPVGRVVGGAAAGRPVATKAGAFGDRTTIRDCLDALAGYHV